MIYLTFNDAPSGVYQSQVVDVIKELNKYAHEPIKLVALISFRNFKENKKKIKSWYPDAVVKRMVPGLKNWKKNKKILGLVKGAKSEPILARGPMAFWLAHQLNGNVSYDGRGAVKAELTEFPDMIPDKEIVNSIVEAEKIAVLKAKHKISVSNELIEYWKSEFGYKDHNHLIIPCTLSDSAITDKLNEGETHQEPRLIYAGSTAGWQSFQRVNNMLKFWIEKQNAQVIFLSKPSAEIDELMKSYPENVDRKWVDHTEVQKHMQWADYGILIRDKNVTNKVASPVKFAEYLAAGLKVLISPELGDYSELVEAENLGYVLHNEPLELASVNAEEKLRLKNYAKDHLSKSAHSAKFKELIQKITGKD